MAPEILDVVKYIVEQLVENKEQIAIGLDTEKEIETITIRVAHEDTGKVIGKQGKIANAIRTVVKSIGAKTGKRYNVEIIDTPDATKA